jgi:hypothetical protein
MAPALALVRATGAKRDPTCNPTQFAGDAMGAHPAILDGIGEIPKFLSPQTAKDVAAARSILAHERPP